MRDNDGEVIERELVQASDGGTDIHTDGEVTVGGDEDADDDGDGDDDNGSDEDDDE